MEKAPESNSKSNTLKSKFKNLNLGIVMYYFYYHRDN